MQRQYIVKIIGNVSDWISYAGALMKVADSSGSTVYMTLMPFISVPLSHRSNKTKCNHALMNKGTN